MNEPFCRLYISTSRTKDEMAESLLAILRARKTGFTLTNDLIQVRISRNISSDPHRFKSEGDIVFAELTAEIHPINAGDFDEQRYVDEVCRLIIELRRTGAFVAAACAFENIIAQKTGWNWTSESRTQPSTISQSDPTLDG